MTYREVIVEDAITWLKTPKETSQYSFVASLPDISEFPQFNLEQWKQWFIATAELIFQNTSDEGVTLFFQSDIKWQGVWVDKGYLCQKAAEQQGCQLLWHKIICRSPAGTTTFGRPAYSHILCFSKKLKLESSESTPDVISEMGDKTWQRGMGLEACLMMAKFLSAKVPEHIIVNPFCGEGSILAAVNAHGLKAIGIERSPKRAQKAKELALELNEKKWIINET